MLRILPISPFFSHRAVYRRQTVSSGIAVGPRCRGSISVGDATGEDLAAGRDLCATGLIKPIAILSQLHTWFALRQYENPFREKGPALTINRDYTLIRWKRS
jgi:hypothetical protein